MQKTAMLILPPPARNGTLVGSLRLCGTVLPLRHEGLGCKNLECQREVSLGFPELSRRVYGL